MADKKGQPAFFDENAFDPEQMTVVPNGKIAQFTQDVHKVQGVQEDSTTSTTSAITFGETQGRKGHRAPRINMAFSPENHEWIKTRSRQLGMSATEFVNTILTNERLKG